MAATHYNNWRRYMRTGRLPDILSDTGLTIEREKFSAGGNLSLWLLEQR